jgi:hypothetical protein
MNAMEQSVDFVGDVSLIIQVAILFILILGVPLAKSAGNGKTSKNYLRHGYLTAFALGLHTVLVIIVMIVLALDSLESMFTLPALNIVLGLSHIVTGSLAIVLGYVLVGFWFSKPLKNLACFRTKKLMTPTIIIWAISLIIGAIVHLGALL